MSQRSFFDSAADIFSSLRENPLEAWFEEQDLGFLRPTYVLVVVFLIVLVISFLYLKGKKKGSRGNLYLISGITNSGKTALFTRLKNGSFGPTVSSLRENVGKLKIEECDDDIVRHIVDYPGHQEVKEKLMSEYLPQSKCVIFMIDAVNFPSEVRDVANYLYSILLNKHVNDLEIPFLVACNKSDMITAQNPTSIREKLEKELNQLRDTRAAMVGVQGENQDDEEEVFLGYENEPFTFTQLPFEVEFVACSTKQPSLSPIYSFISR